MRKLLTGYVVNFNLRHKRCGHLFQNRYKSVLCEEEAYLLELTRYIHLNPVRAGIVHSLEGLADYPWSGHGAIIGSQNREWQDVAGILAHFGKRRGKAVRGYEKFIEEGIPLGRRPELTGGGLIRSLGGWSAVLSARRKGERPASDQRILGSGEFIEEVWREADNQSRETLRGRGKVTSLEDLLGKVCREGKIDVGEVRGGDRRSRVVKARKKFCQIAVKELEYSGAAVARFIGVATSTVNRYAGMIRNVEK
jgi:hypothetical protein